AITGPKGGEMVSDGKMSPFFSTPDWFQGDGAPKKFNTLIWSFLIGTVIYGIIRLILRKRIAAKIQPLLHRVSPNLLDELMHRSVTIGFRWFPLGGVRVAAIWAQTAWDRFWGWQPEEVWAVVTWFFYAAFLHLVGSRVWDGEKSAWVAVIGFAISMFNN